MGAKAVVKEPTQKPKRARMSLEQYGTAVLAGQKPAPGTMRIQEVSDYLGVNTRVVRKLIRLGIIPRLAGTRTVVVPRVEFLKRLEDGRISTAA